MAKGLLTILMAVAIVLSLYFIVGCQYDEQCGFRLGLGEVRCITVEDYVDKMKAGWVGQMAGVGWGAPTEFR